jgi:hypothetical protein
MSTPQFIASPRTKQPGRVVPSLLLTRREAAAALGLSLSSFERYVAQDVPRVYVGERIVLYRPSDLLQWIDSQLITVSV